MKTITITSEQERKLNLILSIVALDNFLLARRENIEVPQLGKDAMELQEWLLGVPSPLQQAA